MFDRLSYPFISLVRQQSQKDQTQRCESSDEAVSLHQLTVERSLLNLHLAVVTPQFHKTTVDCWLTYSLIAQYICPHPNYHQHSTPTQNKYAVPDMVRQRRRRQVGPQPPMQQQQSRPPPRRRSCSSTSGPAHQSSLCLICWRERKCKCSCRVAKHLPGPRAWQEEGQWWHLRRAHLSAGRGGGGGSDQVRRSYCEHYY